MSLGSHGGCFYRLSNQITLSYPQRSTFSQSLSRLNPSQQIARLKDAGRRVREHLQRPTLERNMTTDPLFHDEETDDIMRPSIIPGAIQTAPMQAPVSNFASAPAIVPVQQEAQFDAGPSSSVTFQDTPIMLPGYNDEPLSGSEGETMPSISEFNVLQAPSPMYRRYASFTRSSASSGMQQPPRSPFDTAQHPAGLAAGPVLSDRPPLSGRPILSSTPSIPLSSRKFNRQKSGTAALLVHYTPLSFSVQVCLLRPFKSTGWLLHIFHELPAAHSEKALLKRANNAGAKPMSKREKQVLRMVFESWREHTVESHASRFRKRLALEQRGML